jgi:NADH-quinone oxidoreductase subunit C
LAIRYLLGLSMDETLQRIGQTIAKALGASVTGFEVARGELVVHGKAADIVKIARFLRDDPSCQFVCIIDVTAIDWPNREQRFDVVYHFLSPRMNRRVRVKVMTDETTPIPSLVGVVRGADLFERETYDIYGVLFTGHPDMRRILTDYGFEGHPLRKDFPLTGFVEVRWDDEQKRVRYDKVKLNQEFRNFDFISPWEGTDYVLPGDEKAPGVANKLAGEPEKKAST